MEHFIDEIAKQLSGGLSRRRALLRIMKGFAGAVVGSLGFPWHATGTNCFAHCEAKCTNSKGVLDFTCFRNCVNSDPNNCGSCGNVCPPSTTCVNGKCVGSSPCETDVPTLASLKAAKAALQAGDTDVAVTPQGCTRYRRTIASGQVIAEELVVNGVVVIALSHTSTESTKKQDADKDGFFEYQATQPVSPQLGQPVLQVTKYSSASRLPTEQTSWSNQGGKIQVTFAEGDSTGTLTTRASYIQGPLNTLAAPLAGPGPFFQPIAADCASFDCSASGLANLLGEAMLEGYNCLVAGGNEALAQRLLSDFVRFTTPISCGTPMGDSNSNPVYAQTSSDPGSSLSANPTATITVNANRLCGFPQNQVLGILFHEIFHLDYLTHNPDQTGSKLLGRVDQSYACYGYCFLPHNKITQCACAKCLDTNTCDPHCSTTLGFIQCNDFGFWCPCPENLHWFDNCTACLVNCPQGLACFGFLSCMPETTNACPLSPPPSCP
jgi:hypothetical protein